MGWADESGKWLHGGDRRVVGAPMYNDPGVIR